MKRLAAIMLISCAVVPAHAGDSEATKYWHQWRGPLATGVAPHGNPPTTWGDRSTNIRWRVPLPGRGHSTPVVWADRLYLTAAVPYGTSVDPKEEHVEGAHDNQPVRQQYAFMVIAVNRRDGSTAWQKTLRRELPREGGHVTGSLASNSAITDGERVYVFLGSRGLYALNMDGELVWDKDLGEMQTLHAHGEGSSPALHGDMLIVNWDHQKQSYLYAFNKRTGEQLWRTPRDEMTSWSTPIIVDHAGRPQVVVSATSRVRGYDLADGRQIWECAGLSRNVVASPVFANGMVYAGNSYDWQAMLAIRLEGAAGDITKTTNLVWKRARATPYVPSPLLYDGKLYYIRHNQGHLTCLDAETGKRHYGPVRLEGLHNIFASPVGAAGRIYISDLNGTTLVIRHGETFELLAVNTLRDRFAASPVIVDNDLYLRGQRKLYCIAADD